MNIRKVREEMKKSIPLWLKCGLFAGLCINFSAVITIVIILTPGKFLFVVPVVQENRLLIGIVGVVACLIGSSILCFSAATLEYLNTLIKK